MHLSAAVVALLPTPVANEGGTTEGCPKQGKKLSNPAQLLPTPTSSNGGQNVTSPTSYLNSGKHGKNLIGALMLPTPMVPNGGRTPKNGAMTKTGQTPDGKKRQVDLQFYVKNFLATPTVNGNYNRKGLSKTSGDGLVSMRPAVCGPTAALSSSRLMSPLASVGI